VFETAAVSSPIADGTHRFASQPLRYYPAEMAVGPGSRIGPYEVTALIGEGGMGQVWRAHHTGLKRDDALKVLPDAFASDPDRLARFRREAQVLASLNHPNIAHVHGLEQSDGVQALVMELVEGPTLADRIAQGPIPVDEAMLIASQIAEALEAAHERGIIHRDLKPANIKLRPDGTVKVLDFGLAKALEPISATSVDATASPTITSPAMMTGVGVLLGTAAYMSPEQARGKAVDKRSDIWAFGCVLYEMLTGQRAFAGEDVADTLANVLKTMPDWKALPVETPAPIRRLLRRCLIKDPKGRIGDASIVRIEIDELRTRSGDEDPELLELRQTGASTYRRFWPLIAATAAGALISALIVWTFVPVATPVAVRRFTIPLSARAVPIGTTGEMTDIALSPDGRTLVLSRLSVGLVKRTLDSLSFEPVRGAERGSAPFFSPDSRWIGFWVEGKLKKVPAEGGLATTICDVPGLARATWGDDGQSWSPGARTCTGCLQAEARLNWFSRTKTAIFNPSLYLVRMSFWYGLEPCRVASRRLTLQHERLTR
jgi:serine/threonine protein kinase